MKPLVLLAILAIAFPVYALEMGDYDTVTLSKNSDPSPFCPATKFSNNDKCLVCHVMKMVDGKPKFGLSEISLSAGYTLPYGAQLISQHGELGLYYENNGTSSSVVRNISHYMYNHPELKFFTMEMQSGGGSVMDAWRAVGIIEEMRDNGIKINTICYGMAASAGTILLAAGDIGNRLVNPHAEIMLHKLWTFAMFKIDDPDTSEDQSELMKHFQTNINQFFINRSNLTKEDLDTNMYKKDWWITGEEAVKLGIADGFVKRIYPD